MLVFLKVAQIRLKLLLNKSNLSRSVAKRISELFLFVLTVVRPCGIGFSVIDQPLVVGNLILLHYETSSIKIGVSNLSRQNGV